MARARPPRRGRRFCRFSFTSGAQSSVLPADLGGSRRSEEKEKRKRWGLGMLGGVFPADLWESGSLHGVRDSRLGAPSPLSSSHSRPHGGILINPREGMAGGGGNEGGMRMGKRETELGAPGGAGMLQRGIFPTDGDAARRD